ncbi:hypothetical protein [Thalassorhabdomicrobium marinisediminis]|uniref:Phage tail tape measure protein domain-containing protein n=1 Tax=Thalassorhabdomicrobium marinisediminis TaxID=2170577 RepID=A0A2T7FVF2_9RHOB|nr:hypothetical protein [Thalassorhabdomicrobium marinisediminis]PVA06109.1 hypothetical protein DC363_12415 [Thalassorhabdomicrobium marinisediminis]
MSELPSLIVDVEARIDKLERGLARANVAQRKASGTMERRAKQSANRINATYATMGKSVAASFTKMTGPLLAGIAGAATVRSIRETTRAVAQLGDEAKRSGVSLQSFQQWKYVAQQNRVGIDQMIDGLKELNLRGDEFAITGKGPAAEAFDRLGYSADDVARKLEDPSAMLLEIIGRMEGLDTAAQIRIADELFGGSAGEQFVQLLSQGEAGIRRTIGEAQRLGVVLDDEAVAKAAELDRKFAQVEAKVATLFRRGTVSAATYFGVIDGEIADLEANLDRLGQLGAADISPDHGVDNLQDLQGSAIELEAIYSTLTAQSDLLEAELRDISAALLEQGRTGAAMIFSDFANEVSGVTAEFRDGKISADDMTEALHETMGMAAQAAGGLGDVAGVSFDGLVNRLGGVSSAIETVARWAVAAADAVNNIPMASAGADTLGSGNPSDDDLSGGPSNAPKTSPRPRSAPNDIDFGLPPVSISTPSTGSTGGGGGGASARQSDWDRELESIAEETAALRLEAEALLNVTDAQARRGDAMDLARSKADLLNAAVKSGMADTPELRTQIDQLAQEYVAASSAADLAADKIREVQEASQRGAQSITDVFTGMASGALTAEQAVGRLILQILKLSLQKRMMEAAEGATGWLGTVFKVIGGGFAQGGYTGNGGKYEPAGIVHRGEWVFSKQATTAIGADNLAALHSAAQKGYASGGLVGAAKAATASKGGASAATGPITINAPVTVEGSAGTPEQNDDLAKKMAKEMENSMRRTVVTEIGRQMRPGNMLNRGKR